jgi:hypothetical protein
MEQYLRALEHPQQFGFAPRQAGQQLIEFLVACALAKDPVELAPE